MRKISLAIFAAALLVAGTVSANPLDKVNPKPTLSGQIHQLLKANYFNLQEDIKAEVRFTINKDGEIVVLSVDTQNNSLENFVKGRLNYQKADSNTAKEGRIYTVPVRITA